MFLTVRTKYFLACSTNFKRNCIIRSGLERKLLRKFLLASFILCLISSLIREEKKSKDKQK
ncbi:hypothetical protein BpHYR1_043077 [Brachionus plicatilis]|uniref:Uncharacterized protein n=1 Tax=Brachionus plicatilis TaxID=10195 RepID=A0A3M7RX60_BRAPC|nr:hypothetical protein BpHYR1_043077 [Brachionus plicatilis]